MRTKLLRAMAHLKAARAHVHAASAELRAAYAWDQTKAVDPIYTVIDAAAEALRRKFAEVVWASVKTPTRTP